MSVRETLNKHPTATSGATIVLILCAIPFSLWYATHSGKPPNASNAYYTTDDGQTTFVDDFFKPYPFDHDGKPAYRAYMFQTGSGKKFVGYLERYTSAGLSQLGPILQDSSHLESARQQIQNIRDRETEVKKPNDPNGHWAHVGSAQAESIRSPVSPEGPGDSLIMLFP